MDMNLKIKLYLENDNEKFMGIGVLWLLQTLQTEKSLRAAAARLGISYSKAYSMISNLEKAVGRPVVERKHGGHDRGGVVLTPWAKSFIELYDSFQNRCKDLLNEPFEEFRKKLAEIQ